MASANAAAAPDPSVSSSDTDSAGQVCSPVVGLISETSSDSDDPDGAYDTLLSKFYREMNDVESADKVDLQQQEKQAAKMKANLEKKKAKILERVNGARLEIGRRAAASPLPKNPRQALARETYLQELDTLLTRQEEAAQKKTADVDTRLELVQKRIEKRRRASDDLINKLKSQQVLQEAAAKEREENEERNAMLDLEALEANLSQGQSPPVAMPASERVKEKERTVMQMKLLRDIRDTRQKYALYMEEIEKQRKSESEKRKAMREERDEAIRTGGPVPVFGARAAGDTKQNKGEPSTKQRRVNKDRKKDQKDEAKKKSIKASVNAVATASYNIAAYIMDWRIAMSDVVPDADTDVDLEPLAARQRKDEEDAASSATNDELRHEKDLECAILPDRLRSISVCSEETHVNVDDMNVAGDNAQAHAKVTKTIAKVVLEQNYKIIDRLTLVTRIQHLHSLALLHSINVTKATQDVITAGTGVDEEVQRLLKGATKATLLASDADLKSLPFNDVDSIMVFLNSRPRIEKLCNFLITYMEYDSHFPTSIVYALFTPKLQDTLYWSGRPITTTGLPPDAECMPRVLELLLIRVAMAAHNIKHINDDIEFSEEAFVKGMRYSLYNTKRNKRKRDTHLKQRLVNRVNLTAGRSPPPKRRKDSSPASISLVFDQRGDVVPQAAEEDVYDGEASLYDKITYDIDSEHSTNEVDVYLEEVSRAYEDEPRAVQVLNELRAAISIAPRDQSRVDVIKKFKDPLSEIRVRK